MSIRLRWLSGSIALAALLIVVTRQQAGSSEVASLATDLVGVWSLTAVDPGDGSPVIQPSQPGLYIFAQDYYSAVYAPGSELRVKSATSFQPTEEEMIAQYETIIVNTGRYEISGSTVTFRPVIAKSPGFVGGYQVSTFRIAGDTLVLTADTLVSVDGVSPSDFRGSLTLVRVARSIDVAEARAGIAATWDAFRPVWGAGDAARAAAIFFTDDAINMIPATANDSGLAAIETAFAAFASSNKLSDVTQTTDEVQVWGQTAYERGTFIQTVTQAEGQPYVQRSRYLAIWSRQSDGKWKCVRFLFNDLPQ